MKHRKIFLAMPSFCTQYGYVCYVLKSPQALVSIWSCHKLLSLDWKWVIWGHRHAIRPQYDANSLLMLIHELIHWALGDLTFQICSFHSDFSDWWLRYLLWNCTNMHVTGLHWWSVKIGSGNGLVPSGNKPLPERMLTQIYVAIWRH